MYRRFLFACFLLVFAGMPFFLFAQTGAVGTELTVSIFPEHPRPGQETTVSVESYNIDLNRSDVRWFVNDKLVKHGVGDKKLTLSAGKGGKRTDIRVMALGENGGVYSATVVLRPAEVNLLWQAQSYTPPFYRGKALMPYQGTVLVAAIPSFMNGASAIPSSALIYTWMEGDTVIGDSSGKGKNLFVFRGDIPINTKTISVTVESPDHTMSADARVDVVPVSPRLLFYEEHPLYGRMSAKALEGTLSLTGDETAVSATPFYFETDTKSARDLSYNWQLNYTPLPQERADSVTLRRTSNDAGRSDLFLEVHHADANKDFQATEKRLMIEFPEKPAFEAGQPSL